MRGCQDKLKWRPLCEIKKADGSIEVFQKVKMAMEKFYAVRDTHTRSITALGYNPARREILMGCEGN